MADYLVTGKKGNGKTLVSVGRIRDAIMDGKVCATNLDLYLEHMLPLRLRNTRCFRLPDKPTRADLDAIGRGNDTKDETKNGILVLDELATWLNSRTFGDKERQGVLEWLTFSRKLGWDTYLICQHANQIDKQVREALCEYHVVCRRMDRLKVPFMPFKFPRIHMAFVKYGMDQHSILSERWIYRGNDLFNAYDTEQRFTANYPHGLFSYLPPWHLKGYCARNWKDKLKDLWRGPPRPVVQLKPKLAEVEALMVLSPEERVTAAREVLACD